MSNYRSENDAAQHRARVLQEELELSEATADAQRDQIERQNTDLAAKEAELADLRARVAGPRTVEPRVVRNVLLIAMVVFGLVLLGTVVASTVHF